VIPSKKYINFSRTGDHVHPHTKFILDPGKVFQTRAAERQRITFYIRYGFPTRHDAYFFEIIKGYQKKLVGRDDVVCITTHYRLDGPGIKSQWGKIFLTRPDRPWGRISFLYNG
jgi:hypothetical protein